LDLQAGFDIIVLDNRPTQNLNYPAFLPGRQTPAGKAHLHGLVS